MVQVSRRTLLLPCIVFYLVLDYPSFSRESVSPHFCFSVLDHPSFSTKVSHHFLLRGEHEKNHIYSHCCFLSFHSLPFLLSWIVRRISFVFKEKWGRISSLSISINSGPCFKAQNGNGFLKIFLMIPGFQE